MNTPEVFAQVTHRAVINRQTQLRAFRTVAVAETMAFVLLVLGRLAMIGAVLGITSPDTARAPRLAQRLSPVSGPGC